MSELANLSEVAVSTVSKIESGQREPSPEVITSLAGTLDYPEDFFEWRDQVYGFGSSSFYHRKQQSLPQKTLRKIQAVVNLQRMRARRLSSGLDLNFPLSLPEMPVEKYGNVEEVARALRATWRIPFGPIQNLIEWLEAAGCIVIFYDFGTHKISAISVWAPGDQPIFIVNSAMPPCHQRFSMAHELGHLVMHNEPDPVMENEADRFAAELLMPASEMRQQLRGFNLALAARLKPVWRVSMSALIKRALDLGVITERQRTSLHVQMSQKGWNKSEPVQIAAEDPTLLMEMIRIHRQDFEYNPQDLANLLGMQPDEWSQEYSPRRLRPVS
jgi:Zn-dependent peptidase ImmA (M78 family)